MKSIYMMNYIVHYNQIVRAFVCIYPGNDICAWKIAHRCRNNDEIGK